MRKKIICIFVALALMSLALALIPTVFSQPENIKVVSYSYYGDNQGFVDVAGEVQNVGPNTIDSVYLTGSLYSSSEAVLSGGNSFCKVWVAYLLPQQKAPFYMEFLPNGWAVSDISKVSLTVSMANATSSYQYPDLTITSNTHSIGTKSVGTDADLGVYWVNCNVQNTGSQTAQSITVFGTFYNNTGSVVAIGYSNQIGSLDSAGTASFKLGAFDLNQTLVPSSEKIDHYSLLIQALGPILQGTAPIVTPYPSSGSSPDQTVTSSPTSSPSSSSSSSGSVNNPINSLPPVLIAIIVVIAILAVAGTLLALRKRKPQETKKAAQKATEKTIKKARPKRMVEILPRAFFSKPQGAPIERNVPLFKYFLRTQVCL